MSKEITKAEALERIFHYLRGLFLTAIIKEWREPYQFSMFVKGEEVKIRQAVSDILDAFKTPPPPPAPPAPAPQTTRK